MISIRGLRNLRRVIKKFHKNFSPNTNSNKYRSKLITNYILKLQ